MSGAYFARTDPAFSMGAEPFLRVLVHQSTHVIGADEGHNGLARQCDVTSVECVNSVE